MSAAKKSGWERNPIITEIDDILRDINARLDKIEGYTNERRLAKEASDAMRGVTADEPAAA
jgi:hypothetical protein